MSPSRAVTFVISICFLLTILHPGAQPANAATEGADNNYFGTGAGSANGGSRNSFFGGSAGNDNTGFDNSFFGWSAGKETTTGGANSFFGRSAGEINTEGQGNSFFGFLAGSSNQTGQLNSNFGYSAGSTHTAGLFNSFFGAFAGGSNTTGDNNSFIGAGTNGVPGITNATAVGFRSQVSQSDSLVLGSIAGLNDAPESVKVGIGTDTPDVPLHVVKTTPGGVAATVQDGILDVRHSGTARIRFANANQSWGFRNAGNNIFTITDETSGLSPVRIHPGGVAETLNVTGHGWGLRILPTASRLINTFTGAHLSSGGVWTNASSRGFKTDVEALSLKEAVEVLRGLDPVTFTYKAAPGESHVGFIAEDVPELVATADRLGLSPMDIVAVAVRVLQQANDRLDAKDAQIVSLESRVSALESADHR